MSSKDLDQITRVHFIGIGGIGMSALARHLRHEKKVVSGSDASLNVRTEALAAEGIQIFGSQTADNITDDIELVVYTEAMSPDHEEMKAAKKHKIPMLNYFDALGAAMNPYYLIAIAGTHGKTTTTAMTTDIFEALGKDPTAIIGSLRSKTNSNYRAGKSKYAIVEACEFKADFLSLKPDVLVITNLEHEHVDYYPDLAAVQKEFKQLVSQVHETGVVITHPTDPNIAPVVEGAHVPVKNYHDVLDLNLVMKQPGLHNRLNAAAALAVAQHEKLPLAEAKAAVGEFAGTWRRFEFKGECNGALVYDDYAHHPTEIRATINATREAYPDKRVIVAFQPHTFSRTKGMFNEFAKALAQADYSYILPIYAAREENDSGVSSRELAVKTMEYNPQSQYSESIEKVTDTLRAELGSDDVLVVMGAGDVSKIAAALTK